MITEKEYLDAKEAAKQLHISPKSLCELAKKRQIGYYRPIENSAFLFSAAHIQAFKEKRSFAPQESAAA